MYLTDLVSSLAPASEKMGRLWSVWVTVLSGLLITVLVAWLINRAEEVRWSSVLEDRSGNPSAGLNESLQAGDRFVKLVASLFEVDPELSRAEFDQILEKNQGSVAGLQVIKWIPIVPESKREQFVESVRNDSYPDFELKKWQKNDTWKSNSGKWAEEYAPVCYVHPLKGNEPALGTDLLSNPIQKAAFDKVRDSAQTIATAKTFLSQEAESQAGFQLLAPVYQDRSETKTIDQRRDHVNGYVLAEFRIEPLVEQIHATRDVEGLQLRMTDELADTPAEKLLFESAGYENTESCRTVDCLIGGRKWKLAWSLKPGYVASRRNAIPRWTLLIGSLLSGLFGLAIYSRIKAQLQAESSKEELQAATRSLRLNQFSTEHSCNAVFWPSATGQFTYANQAACQLLGYSKEELLRLKVADIDPSFPQDAWQPHFERMREQQYMVMESQLLDSVGKLHWVELHLSYLNFQGEERIVAICNSIEDRKASEQRVAEALRQAEESEGRFRGLADAATPLSWITELDATCSWLNQRWVDYCGNSLESQLGFGWVETIHPDDREIAQSCYEDAFEKQVPFEVNYRLRRHDGEYRWHTANAAPRFDSDNNFAGFVGMSFDSHEAKVQLEELKQSRLELEESNSMRSAMLDLLGTSDGVWDWKVGTQIYNFAPGFRKLLGFEDDDLKAFPNTLEAFESRVHPEDLVGLWQRVTSSLESNILFIYEYRLRRADDQYIWVRSRGRASFDNQGEATRLVGSTYDISEAKEAQIKLEKEGEALARSNADLAQFAHVASHDLQEPLRAVGGFLQLIENKYADQLDEQGRGYIKKSVAGASRMSQLIEDLLMFSRVTRSESKFVTVDLDEVVEIAIQEQEESIKESNARIEYDSLPTVQGAQPLLVQLFRNLIGNAVKYRGYADPVVKIASSTQHRLCRICIDDNGIGIAPEYHEQVFDLFQRLHHRADYPGTGIGLAICRRVVERHGGTITIEPRAGTGSRFVILLPTDNPAETSSGGPARLP